MGRSNDRKRILLARQPQCIYCGGESVATTVDHCPPRNVFHKRAWPVGYEFASCFACNDESAKDEQVVALLVRFDGANPEDPAVQAEFLRNLEGVNNNHKDLLREMFSMPVGEKRRMAKEIGMARRPGETFADLPFATIPEALHKCVENFAAKLCKALYFFHTNKVLPKKAPIRFNWATNASIARGDNWFEVFIRHLPGAAVLTRNGKDLKEQFDYRYAINVDPEICAFAVSFGRSIRLIVVTSPDPAVVEGAIERAKATSGRDEDLLKAVFYPSNQGSGNKM